MLRYAATAFGLALGILVIQPAFASSFQESVSAFDAAQTDVDPGAPDRLVLDLVRPASLATAVADTRPLAFAPFVAEGHLSLIATELPGPVGGGAHALSSIVFAIEGPATVDPIPVLLDAFVSLEVFVSASLDVSESEAFLVHPGGEVRFDPCDASGCTNVSERFNETIPLHVPANQVLQLALGVNVAALFDGARGAGTLDGVVRARLRIDPAFPLHDQYRIVPEPGTALLLAVGLAAFAARSRRRA